MRYIKWDIKSNDKLLLDKFQKARTIIILFCTTDCAAYFE